MRPGVLAGLLGCTFGVLGILTFGIIFVPLAAVCSLAGFLTGVTRLSGSGIGVSVLGAILALYGAMLSPTIWPLVAAVVLAGPPSSGKQQAATQVSVPVETGLAEVDGVSSRMAAFNKVAESADVKMRGIEDQFQKITQAMEIGLTRQTRRIPFVDEVSRGQIDVSLNQANVRAANIHSEFQSSRDNFERKRAQLIIDGKSAYLKCQDVRQASEKKQAYAQTNLQKWIAACNRLVETAEEFTSRGSQVADSLRRTESVWQAEQAKQAIILRASDIASR